MRRNRALTKIISFALSLILVFYVIPSTIYTKAAELLDGSDEPISEVDASSSSAGSTNTSQPTGVLFEDISLREESVKHFHLEDGTYLAAQYNYPVHTLDSDGAWQDIDNALSESGSEFINSNARIKFAKKINGSSELFALHDGNTKLTLTLIDAIKGVVGEVTNNSDAEADTKLQKMMNLEKLSASVIYRDILDGVDLEYVAYSMNVKENIIVKEKKDSYTYSFELKLNGLTPTLTENGDIEIREDGADEIKYLIPAPVVFDANGEHAPSTASAYTLTHKNGKKYILTVTVDSAWMNDETRAFPVTVDPTVEDANTQITDTYIDFQNSTFRGNTSTLLYVDSRKNAYWSSENLPTIPRSANIVDATFKITVAGLGMNSYIGVYDLVTGWDSSLCADYYSNYGDGILNSLATDYCYVTGVGNYTFDITRIVKSWYDGNEGGNILFQYGIGFAPLSGYSASVWFHSNEASDSSVRPTLTITYKDMKGVESYWPITSHGAGTAGSGSVNLANGNLVFTIPTLTATDSIFSFTPTLVYDASMSGKAYYDQTSGIGVTTPFLGYGFKLNMNETLRCQSDDDVTVYYVYSDADGTEHRLLEDGTTNTHKDEDGLGLTLTTDSSGNVIISSESGGIRFFEKVSHADFGTRWRLSYYQDVYGNRLVYSYMQIYYDLFKPTKVSLLPNGHTTAIDLLELRYHSTTGKLIMVYNPATEAAAVLRYSSTYNGDIVSGGYMYLRQIDYAYGNSSVTSDNWDAFALDVNSATNISVYSTAKYNYDSAGRLIEAQDVTNGTSIKYTWQNYNLTGVKEYAGTTLGQQLGFSYDVGFAEVRATGNDEILDTSDDILTRYTMDIYGRAVSVYSCSSDGSEMYGATSGVYDDASRENNLKNKAVVGGSAVNFLLNGDFEEFDANGNFLHWTHDSLVLDYESYPQSDFGYNMAGFTPTTTQDATLSQTVFLPAGEYNLSMIYVSRSCLNYEAEVSVTSTVGSGLSLTESLFLNKESVTLKKSSFSTSFEIASYQSGGDYVEIKITVGRNAAGSNSRIFKIDNVMLSNTVGAADYSFVRYGNFEANSLGSGSTIVPVSRHLAYINEYSIDTAYINGTIYDSLRIEHGLEDCFVRQRIYEVNEDDLLYYGTQDFQSNATGDYIISGFAYAPNAICTDDSDVKISVYVHYYQGEGKVDELVIHEFEFLPGIDNWQFLSGSFSTKIIPESESERNKYVCVSAIDIYYEYNNQPYGYALFDNISIIRADVDNYVEYAYYTEGDKKGLLSMKRTSDYTEYYDYDENKNLSAVATSDGDMTFYYYNSSNPHQLSYIVQSRYAYNAENYYPVTNALPFSSSNIYYKTKTEYSYDNYGNVEGILVSSMNEDTEVKTTRTSFTYEVTAGSVIFGALLSETDETGTTIRYYYDPDTCMLDATVNETSGNGLVYNYDSLRRLVSVTPGQYVSSSSYTETTNAEKVEYTYGTDHMLEEISTVSTNYTFSYDEFGNRVWVKAGDNTLASYEYAEKNGKLKKTTYGNGFVVEYVYNDLENLSEIWYTEGEGASVKAYEYEYTTDGQIHRVKDNINGRQTVYTYDSRNRVANISSSSTDDSYNDLFTYVEYDDIGRVTYNSTYVNILGSTTYDDGAVAYMYSYNGENNQLSQMLINTTGANGGIDYTYDELFRLSTEDVTLGSFDVSYTYNYKNYGDYTSGQIGSVTTTVNETTTKSATYSYSPDGNITKITYSDGTYVTYTYDDLGQLTRECNTALGYSYTYTYDNAGNITQTTKELIDADDDDGPIAIYEIGSESETLAVNPNLSLLPLTRTYSYTNSQWGDLLTAYNGTAITYDDIGNPLSYYNGSSYIFTWDGRRLATAVKGSNSMSFTYNDDGLRVTKTVNGVVTTYYYQGSLLIAEETNSQILVYIYDTNGSPVGFKYRGADYESGVWDAYAYEKNIQGDIVAVYDVATGNKLIAYKYNAWGVCSTSYYNSGSTTTATKNSFKYRGYYYDSNLGLYYLQSRYYDPNTCRFINADGYVSTGQGLLDYNMFMYCNNNPVVFSDESGYAPKWIETMIDIALYFVSAVISVATATIETTHNVIEGEGIIDSMAAGVETGIATFGTINNKVNEIYYNNYSTGNSELTSSSYQGGYINRWDRLDYTKQQTEQSTYNATAWLYFSEYNLHMYAWYACGWAYDTKIPVFSDIAHSAYSAEVEVGKMDERPFVMFGTLVIGYLGL